MKFVSIAGIVLTALLTATPGAAQPADSPVVDRITAGLPVTLFDDDGRRIEGKVVDISDEAIRVVRRKAIEVVPMPQVVRIEKADSLKNGALTGLVIWGGLGLLGSTAASADGPFIAQAAIVNGFIGAAIGTAIDAMINGRRTLYQRNRTVTATVAPVAGPGRRGAALAITW